MEPKRNFISIILIAAVAAVAAYWLLPGGSGEPQQEGQDTQMPEEETYRNKTAILKTSKGDITLEFYFDDAPKAVENFIRLAESGYYEGVIFHRVIKDFMIQSGDPTGTGRGGESIWVEAFEDELNPDTASFQRGYKKGVLAMANSGPSTNGSQFFIMLEDNPLDNLYTIFGRVVKGQEVVDEIGAVEVGPGDRPVKEVVIKKVEIK